MKRFAWTTILICTLGATSITQAAPKKTTFTPRLTKGDRFILEITKGRTQTGRPEMAKMKGFQVIEVEIMSETEKNILLGWTSRKTAVLGPDGKEIKLPPSAAALGTLFDGVQTIFELSRQYEMIGLKNLDQIRPVMIKAIDKALADMKRSDDDKAKLRKAVTTMLSTRKAIEEIYSNQIMLLMGLAKIEIEGAIDDKPQGQGDTQLPMPFGDGAIPAKLSTKVTKVDRSAKRATVTVDTIMDPEKAAKAVFAAIQAMARKTNRPVPAKKDIPKIDMKDLRTYVVDLKTNIPLEAWHTRTTFLGKKQQTDTIKIVRKPAKATTQPSAKQK
jgi:hypothetical protein